MEKMETPKELRQLAFIYGLNDRELEILLFLAKTRQEMNADELSERLKISRACIMSHIKKLENKGLLLKRRDTRISRKGKPAYVYYVDNKKIKEKIEEDVNELIANVRKIITKNLYQQNFPFNNPKFY